MNKNWFISRMWGATIALLTGFSGVACLLTAFDLYAADPVALALICILAAGICCLCAQGRWVLIPLGAAALILGYMWRDGILVDCVESLLYRITRLYSIAYDMEAVNWSGRSAVEMERTLAPSLYLLGAVNTGVTAVCVVRRKGSVVAALLSLLPLSASMLVTDRVPAEIWLFTYMVGLFLLLLTSAVRRRDETQGNRLTAVLCVPVLIVVGLLFALNPRLDYDKETTAQKYADELFSKLEQQVLVMTGQMPAAGSSVDGTIVDLTNVGRRSQSRSEVMRVTPTNYTGTIYLRGRSLDYYNGVSWTDSGEGAKLPWPEDDELTYAGEVVISTKYAHRMLYLPYYPTSLELDRSATGLENKEKLTMYSVACAEPPSKAELRVRSTYTTIDYKNLCTDLPVDVEKWAKELVAEICADTDNPYEKARAIADYVSQSAKYSLNTGKMPAGRTDFARWFLESSETGYCVHFATATTVLLKAAGIPARYVTGYAVQAKAHTTTVVRVSDAHAWAEFWLPGFGWVMLESTPADTAASDTTDNPNIDTPVEDPDDPDDNTDDPVEDPDDPDDNTDDPVEDSDDKQEDKPDEPAIQTGSDAVQLTPGQTDEMPDLTWLAVVAAVAASVGAAVLQWRIRVLRHTKQLTKGTLNQQIGARWKYLCRLWKYTKQEPSDMLVQEAEQARFGPPITEKKALLPFDKTVREQIVELRSRNLFLRLWYTLVLALY